MMPNTVCASELDRVRLYHLSHQTPTVYLQTHAFNPSLNPSHERRQHIRCAARIPVSDSQDNKVPAFKVGP